MNDAQVEAHNRLVRHVTTLGHTIGERNLRDQERYDALRLAREYILAELTACGAHPLSQDFEVDGREVSNLEVRFGTLEAHVRGAIVLGAHYDSARGSPGANDNATGVALLLELARVFAHEHLHLEGRLPRTRELRFVFFAPEEAPYTYTDKMGSHVYAARSRALNETVEVALSLQGLGSYYAGHHGRDAPFPLNRLSPWRGDFFAVLGDLHSAKWVRRIARGLERTDVLRVRRAVLPRSVPGARSSDHWSFWQQGYPGVLLTDTQSMRTRHRHRPTDSADRIDYFRLELLFERLRHLCEELTLLHHHEHDAGRTLTHAEDHWHGVDGASS